MRILLTLYLSEKREVYKKGKSTLLGKSTILKALNRFIFEKTTDCS
jgi:hypothetical protein